MELWPWTFKQSTRRWPKSPSRFNIDLVHRGGNSTTDGIPTCDRSSERTTTPSDCASILAVQAGIGSELVTKSTPSYDRSDSVMTGSSQCK
jgi:hypothetical protein